MFMLNVQMLNDDLSETTMETVNLSERNDHGNGEFKSAKRPEKR